MIVAIFRYIEAGGAYVPIDPNTLQTVSHHILKDTAANLVVSSRQSRVKLADTGNPEIIEFRRLKTPVYASNGLPACQIK
jgi:non-ribosomal peptide synthetase component F